MQRLFLPPEQFSGGAARIVGADHQHLARVMRARPGERVLLLDNQGNAFQAILVTIHKTETLAQIEIPVSMPPEPQVSITVAQALGKGDKFEQVVQHGTEAGACAFLPVRAERCISDLPADRVEDRLARWRQIAKSAAEQCGRARIPKVSPPVRLGELLSSAAPSSFLLLHPEESASTLSMALMSYPEPPSCFTLAIGPEGGWSIAEVEATIRQGGRVVSLGSRILRTETAALVAISQILYHFENLSPTLLNR